MLHHTRVDPGYYRAKLCYTRGSTRTPIYCENSNLCSACTRRGTPRTGAKEARVRERHGPHDRIPVVHEKHVVEAAVQLEVASAGETRRRGGGGEGRHGYGKSNEDDKHGVFICPGVRSGIFFKVVYGPGLAKGAGRSEQQGGGAGVARTAHWERWADNLQLFFSAENLEL